jgi:hypothetical protein
MSYLDDLSLERRIKAKIHAIGRYIESCHKICNTIGGLPPSIREEGDRTIQLGWDMYNRFKAGEVSLELDETIDQVGDKLDALLKQIKEHAKDDLRYVFSLMSEDKNKSNN